jgi:hypothetical protein
LHLVVHGGKWTTPGSSWGLEVVSPNYIVEEKFLSHAGKEVLMKAVLQAISTYTMSVFKLPKSLCKGINAMFSKLVNMPN